MSLLSIRIASTSSCAGLWPVTAWLCRHQSSTVRLFPTSRSFGSAPWASKRRTLAVLPFAAAVRRLATMRRVDGVHGSTGGDQGIDHVQAFVVCGHHECPDPGLDRCLGVSQPLMSPPRRPPRCYERERRSPFDGRGSACQAKGDRHQVSSLCRVGRIFVGRRSLSRAPPWPGIGGRGSEALIDQHKLSTDESSCDSSEHLNESRSNGCLK
jgi:hypothetical protein